VEIRAVKVFVVARPGMQVSADTIREYCRASLTAYPVPRHVEFRESLPTTTIGKILRRALADTSQAARGAA
jgi:long-chain acyl-CoA synthetase